MNEKAFFFFFFFLYLPFYLSLEKKASIYTCTSTHTRVHTHTKRHTHVHACTYTHTHTHTHARAHTHLLKINPVGSLSTKVASSLTFDLSLCTSKDATPQKPSCSSQKLLGVNLNGHAEILRYWSKSWQIASDVLYVSGSMEKLGQHNKTSVDLTPN